MTKNSFAAAFGAILIAGFPVISAAPIHFAFMRALDNAKLDPAHRQSLWQRYRTAEISTLSALANEGTIRCADTNGIIENTIHELSRPLT